MVRRLLLAAAFALVATSAHAWNNRGHMVVAAKAWDQLGEKQARVTQLLKLNPQYDAWSAKLPANLSAQDHDKRMFMLFATWPDYIKDAEAKHDKDSTATCKANASHNDGYGDNCMHKPWHYKDIPFSDDGTPTKPAPATNALERIETFTAELRSNDPADDPLKSYDLVWLLHLVGDVHQPLHATSRYSSATPNGDTGGNDVTVTCTGCSELHAYWDDLFGGVKVRFNDIAPALTAAGALPAAPAAKAAISDPKAWLDESFGAAKTYAYASPIGPGVGPYAIDPKSDYAKTAKKVAKARAALAGARLANLIKANLN